MTVGPLLALVRKELIQCFRSKPLILLVIWTIAIEIAICAAAITYDVKHVRLAVQDLDGSAASRELVSRFVRTEYFDVTPPVVSGAALARSLESGAATAALVVPPGFERRLDQRLPSTVQLLLDGSDANTALVALGYARRVVAGYSRDVAGDLIGTLPEIRTQHRAWYNPALRSVDFVVVSMLALAVMMIALVLPAAGLAREKEAGTIEQLLVMPFRRWELMLAKIVPTFVVSLGALALAFWVPWWFAVPIRGSVALFFALTALFLVSALGLGLVLGTLAENLQQALLLSFFTLFPVMVVSGVVVPVDSMPWAVQSLAMLSPLTYYLEISLGILVKGVGLDALWTQAVRMGGLGLALLALGLWRVGRRIR